MGGVIYLASKTSKCRSLVLIKSCLLPANDGSLRFGSISYRRGQVFNLMSNRRVMLAVFRLVGINKGRPAR